MTIDKLPSGSYRIRKGYKGQMYSLVVKDKPTMKEAERLIDEKIKSSGSLITKKLDITFDEAARDYINIKKAPLSPSTIAGYERLKRYVPDWFKKMQIADIENYHIQKMLNEYMVGKSTKTVKNMVGFVNPVIHLYKPRMVIELTLPQEIAKDEEYIPTDEDIKKIMDYAKGTRFEIPLILAAFGLRRSEICALEMTDLNGSILTINKAKVLDENRNWIVKTTKTTASARKITLPDNVVAKINELGMYDGCPDTINEFLSRALVMLDIEHFSLHKMRHYFATKMSTILPEADVLALGGWEKSNNTVMKTVYRHSNIQRNKEMQQKAANAMKDLF